MKEIKSICIIDDDPITIFGINKILQRAVICYSVSSYNNGKLAIDGIKDLIKENKDVPELFFLDINMPLMDGWQFLEEFISLPIKNSVRINIITSSIDPLDLQKSQMFKLLTHHCISFHNKPITRQKIEEITQVA